MITVKTNDIKNNFKRISDLINAGEKVVVSRPHNQNIVLLSESEYNELEKARRNAEYLNMLDESMAQAAEGKVITKTLEELNEREN